MSNKNNIKYFSDYLQFTSGRNQEFQRRSSSAVAVVARGLARHRRRQAEVEEGVPHLHHDRRQDRRLLPHGCQSNQA